MRTLPFAVLFLTWACASPPSAETAETQAKAESSDEKAEEEETPDTESEEPADAGAITADASAEPASVYEEPPPTVVRRHHVYAKMKWRVKKLVTVESLLSTASGEDVSEGDEAVLQRKMDPPPDAGDDWEPVADVIVKKITKKGSVVAGNARQELQLEVITEHAAAKDKKKTPFRPRVKVRLQIDKAEAAPAAKEKAEAPAAKKKETGAVPAAKKK